ncbi:MAG: phosphopyruvate hydratase [Holosporales bacterium]|jgi:enolase|nr:phosphopyruvate hydratase [Holosporales bacterium]
MSIIKNVFAREILDSRGLPTIETEVILESGITGRSAVPSGASTGSFEALELRDGGTRFLGKGTLSAVKNVNTILSPALIGNDSTNQNLIDKIMLELDGTDNKSKLGANAILSVSVSCCIAAANYFDIPLYRYIGGLAGRALPKPMMNILNGGAHADNKIDVQEFMIIPAKSLSFKEYVVICSVIYQNLKKILKEKGLNSNVGDEGGVAPSLSSTREALDLITLAIEKSGYKPGEDIQFALDVASSEFFNDGKYNFEGKTRTPKEMIDFYSKLIKEYPIASIEDPLAEEDWNSWKDLTNAIGDSLQIVGDDLFVTNKERLRKGVDLGAANAILIKLNQIGTLTETLETIALAKQNNYNVIISHRSGETCDTTISDLAVATSAPYIKTGAPCRGERIEKYNRLLRIEERFNS